MFAGTFSENKTKNCKPPKCTSVKWINVLRHTHTTEYHVAPRTKKAQLQPNNMEESMNAEQRGQTVPGLQRFELRFFDSMAVGKWSTY